mmetsp:Transcript_33857/g.58976  ORF Transcript_33857/g.58976 Transcript_33857/m.58976 type:complete len:292 (-) Transcript_33857:2089-2964(-)
MTDPASNHKLKLSQAIQDDELIKASTPREALELSSSQNERIYYKGLIPTLDSNDPQAREKCRFAYELMSNVVSQMCKAHKKQQQITLAKAYTRWRHFKIDKTFSAHFAYELLSKAVSAVVKKLSQTNSLNLLRGFKKWRHAVATEQAIQQTRMTIQRLEDDHQKKLLKMGADVNQLQSCQADLERQISGYLHKEKEYKEAIRKINDRKRMNDEGSKDSYDDSKDSTSDIKVKELEQEHQELLDRLAAIEDNVVNFISEMSNLLEAHETTVQKQADKPAKKRSTVSNFAAFK